MNIQNTPISLGPAAGLLKAMGNESRLLVLCELGGGECSVGELQGRVGLTQSALSQHLAILRRHGLVATRRDSRTVFYAIADPAVRGVVATLSRLYCPARV